MKNKVHSSAHSTPQHGAGGGGIWKSSLKLASVYRQEIRGLESWVTLGFAL